MGRKITASNVNITFLIFEADLFTLVQAVEKDQQLIFTDHLLLFQLHEFLVQQSNVLRLF